MPAPRIVTPSKTARTAPSRAERLWYAGLAGSVLLHLIAAVALAGVLVAATKSAAPGLDSQWLSAEDDSLAPLERLAPIEAEAFAGMHAKLAPLAAPGENLRPLAIDPLSSSAESPIEATPQIEFGGDLLAEVELREPSSGDAAAGEGGGDAGGGGEGEGGGGGRGGGFFGIEVPGKRFVYVVDRSGSMNAPHSGPGDTRFGRVKLELAGAVAALSPEDRFFIIFFDQNAYPMPAPTMQPATPEAQAQCLQWLARVRALGDTDPRAAMTLALALEPDVVFFLTDGDFVPAVRRELLKLRQDRIAIHTFAFGNRRGQNALKTIAENNGGTFTFVP